MEALILGTGRLSEVEQFYILNGASLREFDTTWATPMMEAGKLHVIGLQNDGKLIGVAWIAEKQHNVLLRKTEEDNLMLVDLGPFVDSGGWLFRRDAQSKGLLKALAASVITLWFEEIDQQRKRSLWGRVMGVPCGTNSTPLFWELAGEKLTGLDYKTLWALPLGESERQILERWPSAPVPVEGELARRWDEMAHVPHPRLVGVERLLIEEFGNRPVRGYYMPQSLGLPLETTYGSALDDMGELLPFLTNALHEYS